MSDSRKRSFATTVGSGDPTPVIADDFDALVEILIAGGDIPKEYNPHQLENAGGNYTGHFEFHLAEGRFDVLVIYMPRKSEPSIRFVRMGSHDELFRGKAL